MKDNELHSDPAKYANYNGHTAEEEIAAGATEALYQKLRFIDHRIAELENLQGRTPKGWVSFDNLTKWYELIEAELLRRKEQHILKTIFDNTPVPDFLK